MKAIYLVAGFGVALFSTPLFAEDTAQAKQFNKLDKDKDGYISQQEAKSDKRLSDQWDTADADSDGKLEMSEFSAFETGKAADFTPPDDPDAPGMGAAPAK